MKVIYIYIYIVIKIPHIWAVFETYSIYYNKIIYMIDCCFKMIRGGNKMEEVLCYVKRKL